MKTPLLAFAIAIASASAWAQEARKEQPSSTLIMSTTAVDDESDAGQNSVRFLGTEDEVLSSAEAVEMRRKLSDPAEREALRTQTVNDIKRRHPDLIEALNLTPKEYEALIEMQADYQMEHFDLFYSLDRNVRGANGRFDRVKQNRDALNSKLTSLLGEERFSRYESYQRTVHARMEIAEINRTLAPKDVLKGERKARFIQFLMEEQQRFIQSRIDDRVMPEPFDFARLRDPEQLAQYNREMNLKINEQHLAAMEAESPALKERAASILTPAQLARYAEREDKKLAAKRRSVENMRAQMQPKS